MVVRVMPRAAIMQVTSGALSPPPANVVNLYLDMNDRARDEPADEAAVKSTELDSSSELIDAAFREHHAALVQYLRRQVGTDADARDSAQEAYLRLLRYRENQTHDSLKALLFRIAANVVAMRARAAQTQHWASHYPLDDTLGLPAEEPSQERRLAAEQQLHRLPWGSGRAIALGPSIRPCAG